MVKIILGLLCIFLLFGTASAAGQNAAAGPDYEGEPITAVFIKLPPGRTNAKYWQHTAETLIPFKSQDRFSSDKLVRTLNILKDSGLFSQIRVDDPIRNGNGIALTFHLTPYDRIRYIEIDGAFPYFQKEILNVMSIRQGDVFRAETVEKQKERIVSFFKKEGFINPEVKIFFQKDASKDQYTIRVAIEKGDFYKVASVEFKGLDQLKRSDFKIKTSSIWSKRLNRKQVLADEKKIRTTCWEKGFADAFVSVKIETSIKDKSAKIFYTIDEGPLFRVVFEGNKAVGNRDLKKAVVWEQEGDRHGFGIKKTIREIRRLYKEKGFIKAKIHHEVVNFLEAGRKVRKISVSINEGRQHRIADLQVSGCRKIEKAEILGKISSLSSIISKPVYDPEKLEGDINAIKILYLNKGFQKTGVEKHVDILRAEEDTHPDSAFVDIGIRIQEGPQTLIRNVMFKGLIGLSRQQAMEMIASTPEKPYRKFMLESDENILKAAIAEKGYPHVTIRTDVIVSPGGEKADISFDCMPGPFVRMGEVIYAGNFRTKPSVMDDEIEPGTSKPLSLKRLLLIRKKLSDIEALDAVRFRAPGLKEKASTVNVVAEVFEKKPYYVELETGYDTKRKAYARSGAGDQNFLGRNLDLSGGVEVSQIGYHVNTGLKDPNFLGAGVSSVSEIFLDQKEEFNKDFGTRTSGLSQELAWSFFDGTLTASLGGSYRYQKIYAVSSSFFSDDPDRYQGERAIFSAGPSITFRTTDSFVRPTRGAWITAGMNVSKGLDDEMDSFIRYKADARYYFTPIKRLTLAARGRYGLVQSYGGQSDIPEDQLFFLGGTSSVRGFEENKLRYDASGNAVGGRKMVAFSLEARIDIHEKFELAVFADTGSIASALDDSGSDGFRSSGGLGLRYHTPIGPVSLLYGHKLDPKPGESAGEFHFSLGYTF